MGIHDLPLVNAVLNATSASLLVAGFLFIRRKDVRRHHFSMVSAFVASCLFLISYLVYHSSVGSVRYTGQGGMRTLYFSILISHTILATLVPPMAIVTLVRALRERFDRHRRLARWTLPVWLYVSFTGVAIYIMLYRL
jgi:uncharacterized membrane protein YozB (DUF420 family)